MSYPNGDPGKRVYRVWGGQPKGVPEDVTRCIEEVWPSVGYLPSQCRRKRGHGLNGQFCKQHAKRYPALSSQGCDEA